jgi:predicted TIM-barrel enzyme
VVLYSVPSLAEVLACDPSTEHRAPLAALKQAGKKYHEYPIQLQAFYFMAEAGVP